MVESALAAMDDRLGTDLLVLDVGEVLAIAEFFVLGSGANARQVRALVEEVEQRVKEATGESPLRIEGNDDWRWVLMDYGDVIVHVFDADVRSFYELERLWADVPAYRPPAPER